MSRASCSKCNMTMIQQPGKEKLLISKTKSHRIQKIFLISTFLDRKKPSFLIIREISRIIK